MSIKDTAPSLQQWYNIRDTRVKPFIEQHPFLLPNLPQAPAKIAKYFPGAPLALEVYVDHEIPDWVTLNLVIGINDVPEDKVDQAVEQIHRLDQDWWLDEMLFVDGKMLIKLGIV